VKDEGRGLDRAAGA